MVLIDDMESGDGNLEGDAPGEIGAWFTFNDTTGTQLPAEVGGKLLPTKLSPSVMQGGVSSTYAMHTTGTGFTGYGAGIGFNMNDSSSRNTFDASSYTGFLFYARVGPGTGSTDAGAVQTSFRLNVPTKNTDAQGCVCDVGTCPSDPTSMCSNHYGKEVLGLTSSWQPVTVKFSSLQQQPGFGATTTWDPQHVYGVNFQAAPGPQFDFWIDDIYFTE